ncbi:MAG: DUF3662 domain-containing protein [Desulfotomaculum sp.]|nr:DUF3662 domain-containing protein [Desulfotomaculum sp.]
MGLFFGLEGNLERYIEGFFKGKFKGRVQPVEIAKQLYREMSKNRRVSISKIYVPNEYKVQLHPDDWKNMESYTDLIVLELKDYLAQKAQEKELVLVGSPVIEIEKNSDIVPGEVKVNAYFGEAIPVNRELIRQEHKQKKQEAAKQNTILFKPIKEVNSSADKNKIYRLQVKEGRDAGNEFILRDYRMVIGRRDTCDIVIKDPSVSRRHAVLDSHDKQYILTDLNSTNGTYVNGLKITKKVLEPGDVITLGTTKCVFKVD